MPDASSGGDYWELVARFDDGRLVFAQAVLTELGWGGRKAAIIGAVVEPDGSVLPFRRTEKAGDFRLSDDRRTIELGAALLEPREGSRRLYVRKSELRVDVEIESALPGLPVEAPEGCRVDILDVASPARGLVEPSGRAAATAVAGRATFTHRSLEGLEADYVTRRLELFVLEDEVGVYFSEVLTPGGDVLTWAVLRRGDEIVFAGRPARAEVAWAAQNGEPGKPGPVSIDLDIAGARLSLRDPGEPRLVMDLLERVPRLFRPWVALRTQPSVRLQEAPFVLRDDDGETRSGSALVKVLYLNPVR